MMLKKQEKEEQEKPAPRMSKKEWTAKHAEIVRKNKVSPRYELSCSSSLSFGKRLLTGTLSLSIIPY